LVEEKLLKGHSVEGVSSMRMSNASVGNASSIDANSISASKPSRTDHAGHIVALGLAIVSITASERAAAECTPHSPVKDTAVTCTDATLNQNGVFTGYGAGADTGNTITVQPGASVTGNTTGLDFNTGTVINFGKISGRISGIGSLSTNAVDVRNLGSISTGAFGVGIFSFGTARVNNFSSGTISAGAGGVGIESAGTATVSNFSSGRISGGIGILAVGPSTIGNAGTIIGLDGTAIRLGAGADRLILDPGSRIFGAIDMGGGNDVVDFHSSKGIAQLVTLQNFTGTITTSGPGLVFHSATKIATLDPTPFALADRSLLDFTGGISALVQGRLAGADANGRPSSGAIAVSYAPDDRAAGRRQRQQVDAPGLQQPGAERP
jgi:hypothetical protein